MPKGNTKLLLPQLLVAALLWPLALSQQNCPSSEWIENGDFCYLLVKGANGKTFDEARDDCRGRENGADLLWISDASEMSWFVDYGARQWNIKNDWSQCTGCVKGVEAAWIGAYRSDTGIFKWTKDDRAFEVTLYWWIGHPKQSPSDQVLVGDTGTGLRFRTENAGAGGRYWHFCKTSVRG